eukprot:TRINITY_DN8371_c0_g1_i2.p1 TRINITY_DN8371_c0_g1~~TRINITY_DN8371_c0_g1_i2.p1  ORF type:complete len:540 (-),score=159.66 TRINITY_DN8371_c0_g1_i2:65-1684(-)
MMMMMMMMITVTLLSMVRDFAEKIDRRQAAIRAKLALGNVGDGVGMNGDATSSDDDAQPQSAHVSTVSSAPLQANGTYSDAELRLLLEQERATNAENRDVIAKLKAALIDASLRLDEHDRQSSAPEDDAEEPADTVPLPVLAVEPLPAEGEGELQRSSSGPSKRRKPTLQVTVPESPVFDLSDDLWLAGEHSPYVDYEISQEDIAWLNDDDVDPDDEPPAAPAQLHFNDSSADHSELESAPELDVDIDPDPLPADTHVPPPIVVCPPRQDASSGESPERQQDISGLDDSVFGVAPRSMRSARSNSSFSYVWSTDDEAPAPEPDPANDTDQSYDSEGERGIGTNGESFDFEHRNLQSRVVFRCESAADQVLVCGTFNEWSTSGERAVVMTPMVEDKGARVHYATVYLAPGRHEYKFHEPSTGRWFPDPNAKSAGSAGVDNSVIEVANNQNDEAWTTESASWLAGDGDEVDTSDFGDSPDGHHHPSSLSRTSSGPLKTGTPNGGSFSGDGVRRSASSGGASELQAGGKPSSSTPRGSKHFD